MTKLDSNKNPHIFSFVNRLVSQSLTFLMDNGLDFKAKNVKGHTLLEHYYYKYKNGIGMGVMGIFDSIDDMLWCKHNGWKIFDMISILLIKGQTFYRDPNNKNMILYKFVESADYYSNFVHEHFSCVLSDFLSDEIICVISSRFATTFF